MTATLPRGLILSNIRHRAGGLILLAGLAALTLSAAPALAQDAGRMDRMVQASTDANAFSGSVLVAIDGRIVLDRGYGLANREWAIPNDGDTRFRLGSISKQFTAVAIMILNERGLVDLDAPIRTWVPDAPSAWDQVTVRRLLAHTAGVPNFTSFDDFQSTKSLPATVDSLIARFRNHPLDFPPGEGRKYSNSGYVLLTAVIEKASGRSYADFLAEAVFQPLGMADTGYDRNAEVLPRRASGYTLTANGVINAAYWDMSIPQGAGGLYSTTHDLLKWQQGLYGGRLLSPAAMTQLTTPVRDRYAFGMFVARTAGETTMAHSGGLDGFNTYMSYDPARRMSVIVLGNLNGSAPDSLGAALLAVAREGTPLTHAPVAPEPLPTYAGIYDLAPGSALTVTVADDRLAGQLTDQSSSALTPVSGDVFRLGAALVTFTRDASGTVEGLILHQGDRDSVALKQ